MIVRWPEREPRPDRRDQWHRRFVFWKRIDRERVAIFQFIERKGRYLGDGFYEWSFRL